jgi:hypothetical protein
MTSLGVVFEAGASDNSEVVENASEMNVWTKSLCMAYLSPR